ncbi:MAG: protein TolQ [Thermodesulfobacteriota bacterium]|nr:protein TolQ [Thermodesulfobacteriota bacterium]
MNSIVFLYNSVFPGFLERVFKGGVGEIVLNAGPMVQFVLVVLLFFSVVSWAIIFEKLRSIRQADRESKSFLDVFWTSKNLSVIFEESKKMRNSPLSNVFQSGYIEVSRLSKVKSNPNKLGNHGSVSSMTTELSGADTVSRALRQTISTESRRLEKALPFLATTGNTSPFIGLFGTVWGIMDAFRGIGIKGSASLAVVAPGISEALIATAAGLAAAIPAVVAYNHYLNKIRTITSDMENFSSEFLNIVERHFLKKTD